jgi:hypothetical protein
MGDQKWIYGRCRSNIRQRTEALAAGVDYEHPVLGAAFFPNGRASKAPAKVCSWPMLYLKKGNFMHGNCPFFSSQYLVLYVLHGECRIHATQATPWEGLGTWDKVSCGFDGGFIENNDDDNDGDDDEESKRTMSLSSDEETMHYVLLPPNSKFYLTVMSPSCIVWSESYSDIPCHSNITPSLLAKRMEGLPQLSDDDIARNTYIANTLTQTGPGFKPPSTKKKRERESSQGANRTRTMTTTTTTTKRSRRKDGPSHNRSAGRSSSGASLSTSRTATTTTTIKEDLMEGVEVLRVILKHEKTFDEAAFWQCASQYFNVTAPVSTTTSSVSMTAAYEAPSASTTDPPCLDTIDDYVDTSFEGQVHNVDFDNLFGNIDPTAFGIVGEEDDIGSISSFGSYRDPFEQRLS